ncbi:hypothetical protein COS66_01370 [Candidatus Berkelbacteria bacterium CG06_land_8_20_14_3_00_43_10]|nr:MAG: hypothetical protein COS66_01370 [Candidatus Berkelbacteria bacterium CG06_land_8_20_14_3_00_43_10]
MEKIRKEKIMPIESKGGYMPPCAEDWKAPETGGGLKVDSSVGEVGSIEKSRAEQERIDHFKLSENCGVAAYAELTGNVPKEKIDKIYESQGILRHSVDRGALFHGELNFAPNIPVRNAQDYIQAFKDNIEQNKQIAEKIEATPPEAVDEINKKYGTTSENWKYKLFAHKKENYEAWIEESRATLEGFGNAAMESGDNATHELVKNALST